MGQREIVERDRILLDLLLDRRYLAAKKIYVLVLAALCLLENAIDQRPVQDKIRNCRKCHSSAKALGFTQREPAGQVWFICALSDTVDEPVDPDVRIHVVVEKIHDVADRRVLQLFPHGLPCPPNGSAGDVWDCSGHRALCSDSASLHAKAAFVVTYFQAQSVNRIITFEPLTDGADDRSDNWRLDTFSA
jgi:hypothetical protein